MTDQVPLSDHLEALAEMRALRVQDALDAHFAVHTEEARARSEAAKRIDARLEMLNELRSEVLSDRALLVNREFFDATTKATDERIDALHDQIVEWKGREKGLLFIVGAVGFISTVLAIYFAIN